jgi:hypothetical protein
MAKQGALDKNSESRRVAQGAASNRSDTIDISQITVFRQQDCQSRTTALPTKRQFDRENRSFVNANKTMEAAL